jgi:hypothetical protein
VLSVLFRSPSKIDSDRREASRLKAVYGESAKSVVSARAADPTLTSRDRRHWRRIARLV